MEGVRHVKPEVMIVVIIPNVTSVYLAVVSFPDHLGMELIL